MRWVLLSGLLLASADCAVHQPLPRRLERPQCAQPTASDTTVPDTSVLDSELLAERPQMVGVLRPPRYPERYRQRGRRDRVLLEAIIDVDGFIEPESVRAIEASELGLVDAAKEVVVATRFCPGRLNGRRVRVRVQIPVHFSVG